MNNEDGWNIDFGSEEDIEESFDSLLEVLGDTIDKQESGTGVLIPQKIQQMQFAYKVLKYLLKNEDAELSYTLNAPYRSMGSIFVKSKKLKFTDAEWFSRAAEFSSNIDIYPLTDGRVNMTLTFHGIVRTIK